MGAAYRQITACRACGGANLELLLELGHQALTGVFPRTSDERLTRGPLTLVRCSGCGLVQLLHSYDRSELYGAQYGYRSSLNAMMVGHLQNKARRLGELLGLAPGDTVVDIGSNDGTFARFFSGRGLDLLGFDPSAARWRDDYPADSRLVADFFTGATYREDAGSRKARLVTSIAMFYDVEQPLEFMREVAGILADDGVWHLEQSYLPTMVSMNAYDTICHEHLEYYGLKQIAWLAAHAGLSILDVELNNVNGGSFAVTLAKPGSRLPRNRAAFERLLDAETRAGFDTPRPFAAFRERVAAHRAALVRMLRDIRARGQTVLGYGASTKGNVILQFAGIDRTLLAAIVEINADKFGCVTPGTSIPIISVTEAHEPPPDYFLVLPWHFRRGIVAQERDYLRSGGRLIFPLPEIEVVSA